jgi:hypothetical protein
MSGEDQTPTVVGFTISTWAVGAVIDEIYKATGYRLSELDRQARRLTCPVCAMPRPGADETALEDWHDSHCIGRFDQPERASSPEELGADTRGLGNDA